MAHQVIWTKDVYSNFVDKANLSAYEANLLLTRISGLSIVEQSFFFNVSVSKINQDVKLLKIKYDAVQREHPELFKPRRFSAAQLYMDTH